MRFNIGSTLKKLVHLLLAFLGCLHMLGGPYSLIQVYAWAGMLVTYSQNDGIVQAARDTFSGEKPCELCCKIAAAREAEPPPDRQAPPASVVSSKLLQEMLPARVAVLRPPASCDLPPVTFAGILLPADFPAASPPVPPPCRLA